VAVELCDLTTAAPVADPPIVTEVAAGVRVDWRDGSSDTIRL
jgi:hypothetical protein